MKTLFVSNGGLVSLLFQDKLGIDELSETALFFIDTRLIGKTFEEEDPHLFDLDRSVAKDRWVMLQEALEKAHAEGRVCDKYADHPSSFGGQQAVLTDFLEQHCLCSEWIDETENDGPGRGMIFYDELLLAYLSSRETRKTMQLRIDVRSTPGILAPGDVLKNIPGQGAVLCDADGVIKARLSTRHGEKLLRRQL